MGRVYYTFLLLLCSLHNLCWSRQVSGDFQTVCINILFGYTCGAIVEDCYWSAPNYIIKILKYIGYTCGAIVDCLEI